MKVNRSSIIEESELSQPSRTGHVRSAKDMRAEALVDQRARAREDLVPHALQGHEGGAGDELRKLHAVPVVDDVVLVGVDHLALDLGHVPT